MRTVYSYFSPANQDHYKTAYSLIEHCGNYTMAWRDANNVELLKLRAERLVAEGRAKRGRLEIVRNVWTDDMSLHLKEVEGE